MSLAQASLMDFDPTRHEQHMARWNFAGAVGAVVGSFVIAALITAHLGWRLGFMLLALAAVACVIAAARLDALHGQPAGLDESLWASVSAALGAVRRVAVVRWLILLEASDLMLDVFTGFLAVFLVDVAHASPAVAAIAVGLRLGADLFGGLLMIPLIDRVPGRLYLRASAAMQLALFPAFLLVPSLLLRLAILVLLSVVAAGWYPVLQARLYSSMPGRSGTVLTVTDLFNLLGGLVPAAIGMIASEAGLPAAMWVLLISPLLLLLVGTQEGRPPRQARQGGAAGGDRW